MSIAVLGVFVLNLLFFLVGLVLVWAARGWNHRGEFAMLGGIAYMCGLASVGGLGTLIPIFGGGLSGGMVLLLVVGVAAVAAGLAVACRRKLPGASPRRAPMTGVRLLSSCLALLTALALAAFYREASTQPLTSWDSWSFWMTKAKGIYYFGGLPPWIFEHVAGPSYPLFVPTLAAMDFRFMGSANTTTLGVQWWLLLVGFTWAAAGLLRDMAPPVVTWTFLLGAVTIPQLDLRLLERTGDWPLDIFFALAACALLRWIMTGDRWLLMVYGLMIMGVLLTKREGQLIGACLIVAGMLTAGIRSRRSWLAIVGIAMLAYLPDIPWRYWWSERHLTSDTPPGGLFHDTFGLGSRILPSFGLVLHMLFAYWMWLGIAPIAVAASIACLVNADRRPAVFFIVLFALGVVAWAWVNWSDPTLPITTNRSVNPTYRSVGSLVLLSVVVAPILIGRLFEAGHERLAKTESVSVSRGVDAVEPAISAGI
jgi:hypothetical protein